MTRNRRLLHFFVISVFLCGWTLVAAGRQTPSQEGVIRINVNLVQVDAIVTDSKGKPVTDLTADDFEVFQDGKPQAITSFTFVDLKESRVNTLTAPAATQKTKVSAKNALPDFIA